MKKEWEEDYKPASTLSQVEDFVRFSSIWKDMQAEMRLWLDDIHLMLENLDGELSTRTLDRLGGNAEAVRNLLNFPDILLTNAKFEKRKRKVSKK
ncbi:hypothetical protein KAX02_13745 [candidate division WOR-3 bacterium]|nr:hypothetical protein [candidate division WOR-3 bacterium]